MESNPSRANRRISSRPSQGFLERLRRSTRCAFVSFAVVVIDCLARLFVPDCFVPENKKPTARFIWRWVISAGFTVNPLVRQPPCARAHACTTTTRAHAHRAKDLPQHSDCHSKSTGPSGQQTSVLPFDAYFRSNESEFSHHHSPCNSSPRSFVVPARCHRLLMCS